MGNMSVFCAVLVVALSFSLCVNADCSAQGNHGDENKDKSIPDHYNIIFIGATGDLARKYLWAGLYSLFLKNYEENKVRFAIYAGGRTAPDEGRKIISDIMLNIVKCSTEDCRDLKATFINSVQYHQLDKEDHYKRLSKIVTENTQGLYGLQGTQFSYEAGRLVYLSIPPSAYEKTSNLVHKHLRPSLGHPWFRMVLEKPFGHDLASANALVKVLGKNYKDHEIYRIDHYLGKPVVKYMLPFRLLNKEKYEPLWNHEHIERVEIVMKEKIDARGRALFYEEVGVVRDVMQNHLTELLALVAMELPVDSGNISHILQQKQNLLRQVVPPSGDSAVTGQYSSYLANCRSELADPDYETSVPTFAAVVLHINNQRWKGVPFLLMSGKKMDVKSSYVRVLFKNPDICVQGEGQACNKKKQVVFYIGSGDVRKPSMVVVSDSLPEPKVTSGWRKGELRLDVDIFGQSINDTMQLLPDYNLGEAYTTLIQAVFTGQRHLFVDTPSLMRSWHIWTPLLDDLRHEAPRVYEGGDLDLQILDFKLSERGVDFSHELQMIEMPPDNTPTFSPAASALRGVPLVTADTTQLIVKLADDILSAAHVAIEERGAFHLAVPGGSTPVPLFRYLASSLPSFPWANTHLWWVDERCQPLDHDMSNFNLANKHLLSYVNVPYLNIHPMPVHIGDNLCHSPDNGTATYTSQIIRLLEEESLDFVILGVGTDGHVASIFTDDLTDSEDLVRQTIAPSVNTKERMTLTLRMLNRSRHVRLVVLGKEKQEILMTVADDGLSDRMYPAAHVKPEGTLMWYADTDAVDGLNEL